MRGFHDLLTNIKVKAVACVPNHNTVEAYWGMEFTL
jgi:hypothetical protein